MKWNVSILVLLVAMMVCACGVSTNPVDYLMQPYDYPIADNMPPVVDEPMESLLTRWEELLQEKAPAVAATLQPGLSDEEIDQLQSQYDIELPDDIRALYRWHNGCDIDSGTMVTGLHEFYSLERALSERADLAKAFESQGESLKRMMEPTLSWMPLFQDLAGDGYYYDPLRSAEDGAVFDNFRESGDYTFFPSVKNLIAGFIECYEKGHIYLDTDGTVNEDFEATHEIWKKFGQVYAPQY